MPPPSALTGNREKTILEDCQEAIGYRFSKPELLRAALTHTSGANTRQASNERMEFLGDSVLGLITCEQLYLRFPDYQEGDLTKVKSVVVSRKTCARFSQEIGLGEYLFLGKGINLYTEIPSNILADVFEALVAAIFLDGGWDAAKAFVLQFIEPEVERVAAQAVGSNSKSVLQQVAQREFGETPRYLIMDEQGPDHNKCFKVAAEVADHRFPPAWGRNKKEAELKAALNALAAINGEPVPYPSN
jgi:ribonuclease-3